MTFRAKIVLATVSLLSLLFGLGGTALLSASFQAALESEELAVRNSCEVLLETLEIINEIETGSDEASVASLLERIQLPDFFQAFTLASEEKMLLMSGSGAGDFLDLHARVEAGQITLGYFTDRQGTPYLQAATCIRLGTASVLYLDLGRDLSAVYEAQQQAQKAYVRIFLVMLALCVLLSLILASLLTRPLKKLAAATQEIAAGHLSSRSALNSDDEIGALSREFDAMAEQVEHSVSRLKEAALRQEQFMGSFAHELKTPMTSIIGYADLLRTQKLTADEQLEAVNFIFSEGKRLEKLSLQLLDIFVAGNEEIELKPISPLSLASVTVEHLRPVYEAQGIQLSLSGPEGVCLLEPVLTRSLLLNLLDNGRKALEAQGRITVQVELTPEGCRFVISDNGRGMPEEALLHVTEPFYRVDKSRSRASGSAGLGLNLCAKIAELHHGTLKFESQPGVGTTVTAELRGGRT
ncbi:MAG: HAMP domain-containing histidine kinase [Oscillospiraceae bacterium]|nr:HAMP domain-containing histidine kinase [Oscillospiraceae bacterium]